MDATDDSNKNVIILIAIFLFLLLIIALIIAIIIFLIPNNNVKEFGACTGQSDCANGLVCAVSSLDNTTRCLSGLNLPCQENSDCASPFVCLENSQKNKVCMINTTGSTMMTTSPNLTIFDQQSLILQQNFAPSVFNRPTVTPLACQNQSFVQPTVTQLACPGRLNQPFVTHAPAPIAARPSTLPSCQMVAPRIGDFNQFYNQICQSDYKSDFKKKTF
jgi:hypothetical protein